MNQVPICIRIFSNFCPSDHCKSVYERLSESHLIFDYGKDKRVYITTEDDYTHAIILNVAMPVLKNIPKENVVGLAFEPPLYLNMNNDFVNYAIKYIGRYYIGLKGSLPDPFCEHYGYMWHTTPLHTLPEKKRLISIMVSHKTAAPGHQYRHSLVQRILSSSLPVDIYGKGSRYYQKNDPIQMMSIPRNNRPINENSDPRIRGEFEEIEPYEDYLFHIAIENFKTNHYFSEKIVNPLLCGATPVYWGANAIEEYFPGNVIQLSGNLEKDFALLADICRDPMKYKKEISVEKVKDRINLLKNVDALFSWKKEKKE